MSSGINVGIVYCRLGTELGLTGLTFIFSLVSVIGIGTNYEFALYESGSETSCSLSAVFYMYLVICVGQFCLFAFDIAVFIATVYTSGTMTCICYQMKIIVHLLSFGLTAVGSLVYIIKDKDYAGWPFILGICACISSLVNVIIWVIVNCTTKKIDERLGTSLTFNRLSQYRRGGGAMDDE